MWERWRAGDSLHQIAQLFDRQHPSIQAILRETGGIQAPERRRSRLALSLAEREEISRAVVAGQSIRAIAAGMGRAPSTVSREIHRNGGAESYRANRADQAAWDRATRPKICKLVKNRSLAHVVAGKLQLMRRSRHHTQTTDNHGRIVDAVSISKRPATVEDRAVPGHWEGDLLFGSANSHIATLVERQSRYVMLVRVSGKDTETVVNALIKHSHKLPQERYKSLTWDRGKVMADHK